MKYIKQKDGRFTAVDETSEEYALLMALPVGRRPSFLPETSQQVAAWRVSRETAIAAWQNKVAASSTK